MRDVSERSGVHIVAATGFWEGVSYPDWARTATIDELVAYMSGELSEGIEGTGVRAGVIKVATGENAVTAHEARVLRAAARVQRDLGPAIITHTGLGTMGWEQVSIFEQEGADLSRIVIGHLDSQTDAAVFEYCLERGCNVSFDRLGRSRPAQPDDSEKADLVAISSRRGGPSASASRTTVAAGSSGSWATAPTAPPTTTSSHRSRSYCVNAASRTRSSIR
jgi:predicted metal-dependent phosphotriesterase family hydrolase